MSAFRMIHVSIDDAGLDDGGADWRPRNILDQIRMAVVKKDP